MGHGAPGASCWPPSQPLSRPLAAAVHLHRRDAPQCSLWSLCGRACQRLCASLTRCIADGLIAAKLCPKSGGPLLLKRVCGLSAFRKMHEDLGIISTKSRKIPRRFHEVSPELSSKMQVFSKLCETSRGACTCHAPHNASGSMGHSLAHNLGE